MKEELANEVLEAMKKCDGVCFKCLSNEYCTNRDWKEMRQSLAAALLEERAKPKVWDGAPYDATQAQITWFTKNGSSRYKNIHRELPKTHARQIAENIVHGINGVTHGEAKDIEYVEGVLNKYAEELTKKETN